MDRWQIYRLGVWKANYGLGFGRALVAIVKSLASRRRARTQEFEAGLRVLVIARVSTEGSERNLIQQIYICEFIFN